MLNSHYELKPPAKLQRGVEWKEQPRGWAHVGTRGRQVSDVLYIILESDSPLVYFNEDVNYLNSSSPFNEIAKKTLKSFKHLNFYAKIPTTGKLILPAFRLRWTDTVISE